jgi:hypothetical protein
MLVRATDMLIAKLRGGCRDCGIDRVFGEGRLRM